MKYNEVVTYINDIPKFTKKNSMDHTKRFMELLGIREENMKIIHVAGTNGKGSTCAFMNEILCEVGEHVGLFTSPHLEQMTERIRINGREISKEAFVEVYRAVMDVVDIMKQEGLPHPTFFEFLLGMAMKTFAMEEVTYVILETGLGGRLDATNVFARPEATVLTSISMDHERYLGTTLEQIAAEKAGIIKESVPVIYVGNDESVVNTIERKVRDVNCFCRKITDSAYEIIEKTEKYIAFYQKDGYDKTDPWKIPNRGSYQVENGVLAIETLQVILPLEKQNRDKWQKALYQTQWLGRMEEVQKGIFVDGGHNIGAIEAVIQDNRTLDVLLFSAVSDKNYKQMIELLTTQIEVGAYIVTRITDERGVPAEELEALILDKISKPVYVEATIEDAWRRLQELKPSNGKALCLGSLYLVGMIKEYCNKK